jgi:hypothetical protein
VLAEILLVKHCFNCQQEVVGEVRLLNIVKLSGLSSHETGKRSSSARRSNAAAT